MLLFFYGSQGRLRQLHLRNCLTRGIVILPFQCVGASQLLKNGDRSSGLPGATMGLHPTLTFHHLWDSSWSEVSITVPPQPLLATQSKGRACFLPLLTGQNRMSSKTLLWNDSPWALPWGRWPSRQAQASSLSTNICSVGPPSGRVGARWLPGSESAHYEQWIDHQLAGTVVGEERRLGEHKGLGVQWK